MDYQRFRATSAALAACLLVAPTAVMAWNNQGHMAVGEIAYDQLIKSDPDVVREIITVADALPRRQVMDAALKNASRAERDHLIFAYLARWPDDIRGTEQDRPDHHYRLRGVSDVGRLIPLRVGHADREYASDVSTLRTAMAAKRDKAIALAWLFHIVGDMHQPLHAGTWLSWTYPKSDRAGTIAYVRRRAGSNADDLHNYWDGCVDRPGTETQGARTLAQDAQALWPRARLPELSQPAGDFNVWADESATLARRIAYQDGAFVPPPAKTDAPIMTPRYAAVARALADRRVATAGYRLADILAKQASLHIHS